MRQNNLPKCEDCKTENATNDGFYRWCTECFEKGLTRDMDEHARNFFKTEIEEMRMAKFDECIDYVFNNEGNDKYTDRADDKGGPTKFGITLATLTAYQKRPTSDTEVQGLTRDVAKVIAKELFWKPLRLDDVNDPKIATAILDLSFPEGIGNAARTVQMALGVAMDGVIGGQTLEAINKMPRVLFFSAFVTVIQERYIRNAIKEPVQLPNLAGWLHRSQKLITLLG